MALSAYRCAKCGKSIFPRRYICPYCGNNSFTPVSLDGEVTLLTYTRVYNLPSGIEEPYLDFGIVEFSNGVRVTGRLQVKDFPVTGMKLTTTTGVVRVVDGEEKEGFIFVEK